MKSRSNGSGTTSRLSTNAGGYVYMTAARRMTVVRGLHRFLVAENLDTHHPTSTFAPMLRPRELPLVLSIDETEALLETAHRLAADLSVDIYRRGRERAGSYREVLK